MIDCCNELESQVLAVFIGMLGMLFIADRLGSDEVVEVTDPIDDVANMGGANCCCCAGCIGIIGTCI